MPFNDVVGKGDNVAPEQMGATGLNVGVTVAPIVVTIAEVVFVQPLSSFTVIV